MSDVKTFRAFCQICQKLELNCTRLLPHMDYSICETCAPQGKNQSISEEEIENKVTARWTDSQVQSLAAYQDSDTFLPFICERGHRLQATNDLLTCDICQFNLTWAYNWTLDWSWKFLEPPAGAGTRAKLPPGGPLKSASIALDLPEPNAGPDAEDFVD